MSAFKIYRLKPFLILVAILVLPGFLYYILTLKGENRYKPLPVYGPKSLSGTSHKRMGKIIPDTLYHQVLGFQLINQNNEKIDENTYKNKVKVVHFYYEGCNAGCQQVLKAIAKADSNYVKNPVVQFMSITVNAEKEQLNQIRFMAQKFHAKAHKWDFLTGNPSQIDSLLKKGFMVDGAKVGDSFVVSPKIVLLDNQNRIRGYYDGTFKPDLDRLNDEMKVLIVEQLRNTKEEFKNK